MKKMLFFMLIALIGVVSYFVLSPITASDDTNTFEYQNPISSGIHPTAGLRDCQVFRDGDYWYMTGTTPSKWFEGNEDRTYNPGLVLYRSTDLLNWEDRGIVIHPSSEDKWYHRRFWAPEIHKVGDKYYALFNACNPKIGIYGQNTGYAVADNVEGPYTIVTDEEPLCAGNDLTIFVDDDEKVWAFWNRGREFGIGFAQIDLENCKFLTEPTTAITPSAVDFEYNADGTIVQIAGYNGQPANKVKKYHSWDSIGIEGAYVIKESDIYYLFYSSWTRGYEIGYATSKSITGPWTKADNNPFYGAMSQSFCEKNGLEYTQSGDGTFNQVGHNEIFIGPDGRYWLSCHGIADDGVPLLVIDPIDINDGVITSVGPTSTLQTITY